MTVIEREIANINYDLWDRDMSENLWLWRHRQPSQYGTARGRREGAMSQTEAAEALDLSVQQYTNLERGEATLMNAADLAKLCEREVWKGIKPTIEELFYLARRRSGLTVKDVAGLMGLSPFVYVAAEQAGEDRVRAFWEGRGFMFRGRVKRPGKAA